MILSLSDFNFDRLSSKCSINVLSLGGLYTVPTVIDLLLGKWIVVHTASMFSNSWSTFVNAYFELINMHMKQTSLPPKVSQGF